MPDFPAACHLACMLFVARKAYATAEGMAARGAVRQSCEATSESPFPPFGLHWLLGLLQLHNGNADAGLVSFAREIEQTRCGSIYAREFECDALVGTGYAHLQRDQLTAAGSAFRAGLAVMPNNGRALVGLARACPGDDSVQQIANVINQVAEGGRSTEAALLTAGMHALCGDAARACAALESLAKGEPRQDGWMISIDPALATMRGHEGFERLIVAIAARAV